MDWLRAVVVSVLIVPAHAADAPSADPWAAVRFMAGRWQGTAQGQAGSGTVRREYAFALNGRFLHERNVSTYPPQEKNKAGEVHEHWSMMGYDKGRKALVLRQFHAEGFVNTYVLNAAASGDRRLVFDSESFDNFDNRWRARETYDVESRDAFTETFELAPPGKELQVYSVNRLRRAPD